MASNNGRDNYEGNVATERKRQQPAHQNVPLLYSILFLLIISAMCAGVVLLLFIVLQNRVADAMIRQEVDVLSKSNDHSLQTRKPRSFSLLRSSGPEQILCETTKGTIIITLDPVSSPNGVAEVKKMVQAEFFSEVAFFRVNDDITQFGVREKGFNYHSEWIRDENNWDKTKRRPWKRGVVAMIGGTHLVIVKKDSNVMGLADHDTIVGTIAEDSGMEVIDQLYMYNDIIDHPNRGPGPDQTAIYRRGWKYLNEQFPLVDKFLGCKMIE